jgi:hypothetical protein
MFKEEACWTEQAMFVIQSSNQRKPNVVNARNGSDVLPLRVHRCLHLDKRNNAELLLQ